MWPDIEVTPCTLNRAGEDLHERRLTCTIVADNADYLAGTNPEIHAPKGMNPTVGLPDGRAPQKGWSGLSRRNAMVGTHW